MGTKTIAETILDQWLSGAFDKRLVGLNTVDGKSSVGVVVGVEADHVVLGDVGQIVGSTVRSPLVDVFGALPEEHWHIAMNHIVSWGILAQT